MSLRANWHALERTFRCLPWRKWRVSARFISRAFKESMGAPPHRFFMSRRTERAKNLLADPELSVTRIRQELGFSETRAFTTTFRRHSGLTPTAYRRSLG